MIALHDIHKIYSQGNVGFHALRGVSVQFKKGESVAVFGKSGCGKTTLLNIIAGLDQPSSGDMVIEDKLTTKFTESEWDYFRNHNIGFIFQQFNLIEHLPVIENIAIAAKIGGHNHKQAYQMALDMLDKVGLKSHAHKKPRELSGGERQRVGIARALINNPDIILADEPTGALDQATGKQIMELIKEIAKDKLFIMVTHDMTMAKTYANRLIELEDGKIIHDSNPVNEKVTIRLKRKIKDKSLSFVEGIRLSLHNIRVRKWRTALVSFGLAIGIVGLLLISSLFNTVRATIEGEGESLRDNPEISIYRALSSNIDPQSFIDDISTQYTYFADISYVPNHALHILANETSDLEYRTPITLNRYIGTPSHSEVTQHYDNFIGDGRLPENENEFVLPLSRVEAMFSSDINISKDELWSRTKGNHYTISTQYYYTPVHLTEEIDNCLVVEGWDENPDTLPNAFYDRFGDFETHMENLQDLNGGQVLTTQTQQETVHVFCDDYEALTWHIDESNPRDEMSLTLVGIFDDSRINNALFHPEFLLSLTAQPIWLSDEPSHQRENEEKVVAYMLSEHIDQKASIIRSIEADGYRVHETTNISFNFLSGLSMLFSYIIQFIFSSIVGIAVITAGLMLLMVLYISIIERTREIGLIRALGGTRKDVRTIFVGETTLIGLFAGFLSIVLALIFITLGNHVFDEQIATLTARYLDFTPSGNIFSINIRLMIYAIVGSILIAIISGLIPAISASRKQPIEALKKD